MITFRRAIAALSFGVAFAVLPLQWTLAADKLILGMPVKPPPMVHMPVFYALDNGIFEKHGLDVEVKFFRGGVATHRAAASAQSGLDVAWTPAPIAMSGIAGGSGLRIFHSMAFLFEAQLATAPEIKTAKDLRGRTIGIEGRGGYSHLGALSVMQGVGLNDDDVKYIKTPPPARVPFLVEKKADAVLIHVEEVLLAQTLRKGVNKIADLWKTRPHYFYGVFIAPDAKLKSNPDAYVRFAAAMMESNRAAYKDKPGYLATTVKWIKPVFKDHPNIMNKTFDIFVEEKIWSVNNGLPRKTIEWTNNFNTKLKKYKGAAPSYDQLVDSGIAAAALKKVGEVAPSEK
jgi:ABC-type nitrate/sulfonate/bicarbonate transport system substrate-binding protein